MAHQIRLCRLEDIPNVAGIFRQAFSPSIAALVPRASPKQEVFEDIFMLLHRAWPQDLFVAEKDGLVQGYLLAPVNTERLWRYALLSGVLLRWLGKWLLGRYNVPAKALPGIIRNKLLFVKTEKIHSPQGRCGRILSVAVDQQARGRGVGKLLVQYGLQHLCDQGVDYVKLEVRPDNLPALNCYLGLGFIETGRIRDLQGDWLVMLRDLHQEFC